MEAGRELDALVAEKAMGWSHIKDCAGFNSSLKHDITPNYSTDIAAAWKVVEKIKLMQPNPQEFGLESDHHQLFTIEYIDPEWRAGWAPINLDGNKTIEAEADTAPHAICLAALKAVGVEL